VRAEVAFEVAACQGDCQVHLVVFAMAPRHADSRTLNSAEKGFSLKNTQG
jgi:hypothetical protein